MVNRDKQKGLGKSALVALAIILLSSVFVGVMALRSGNQDVRSRAAALYPGETCGGNPPPPCLGETHAVCRGTSWRCEKVVGGVGPTPTPGSKYMTDADCAKSSPNFTSDGNGGCSNIVSFLSAECKAGSWKNCLEKMQFCRKKRSLHLPACKN